MSHPPGTRIDRYLAAHRVDKALAIAPVCHGKVVGEQKERWGVDRERPPQRVRFFCLRHMCVQQRQSRRPGVGGDLTRMAVVRSRGGNEISIERSTLFLDDKRCDATVDLKP
jgi:hypothetical protein